MLHSRVGWSGAAGFGWGHRSGVVTNAPITDRTDNGLINGVGGVLVVGVACARSLCNVKLATKLVKTGDTTATTETVAMTTKKIFQH